MEITMNDIIAFVRKAMENKLYVSTYYEGLHISTEGKDINISVDINKTTLRIDTDSGRFFIKNLTEKELLQYNLLIEDGKSYMEQRGLEDFANFFKEENNNKVKDINDLDNEDE